MLNESSVIFKASLWIHAHYETGEPLEVDLFSISGESVSMELIRWLDGNRLDRYLLSCFNQLRTERCYDVLCKATEYSESEGEYGYRVSGFEIELLSWVENRADEDGQTDTVAEIDLDWLQF